MPSLLTDFLNQTNTTKDFFEYSFLDTPQRLNAVKRAAARTIAPELLQELEKQNSFGDSAQQESLKKLSRGSCATVVTGQQVGFLGGPVFTLYKIASAIKLAQELQKESGVNVVPVFWLQTEDHDFEEIRTASFFSADGQVEKAELPPKLQGVGDMVGRITLPEEVSQLVTTYVSKMSLADSAVSTLLTESYQPAHTLAHSFAKLIGSLFKGTGLLLINPDTVAVKKLAQPLFTRCINGYQEIEQVLEQWNNALSARDYPLQVPIKQNSPLPFISLDGMRQRITRENNTWTTKKGSISDSELDQKLREQPELFSPSALLRPVIQDYLFPNAAYISGAAEFNYLVQAKVLYRFLEVPQSMIVPRNSFVLLTAKEQQLMSDLKVSLGDLGKTKEEFLKRELQNTPLNPEHVFEPVEQALTSTLTALESHFKTIDAQTLLPAMQTTHEAMLHNLTKLKTKYVKALQNKESILVGRFDRLQKSAFPQGILQEREIAGAYYLLQQGPQLITKILENTLPLGPFATRVIAL